MGLNSERVHDAVTTTQLSAVDTKLLHIAIDVKYPPVGYSAAIGDGIVDDTQAIQSLFNSGAYNTYYFPNGTYKVTGLVVPKTLNITGQSKRLTIIKNVSTINPCIKINSTVERGTIRDIGIFGDGVEARGIDATSGNGIHFDGAILWNLDNVWMRGNGQHAIYATGNVNNINITNSEIEYSALDGINVISNGGDSQKNAIRIENCNIAGHGRHGVNIWGNSCTVAKNTIQGNNGAGVIMSSDFVTGAYSPKKIAIKENYFEGCKDGFIVGKAINSGGNAKYLQDIIIEDNYGSMESNAVNAGITSLVDFQNPNNSFNTPQIRGLIYRNNAFASGTLTIANFNDMLGIDSSVSKPETAYGAYASMIGLGAAKFETLKDMVVGGYYFAKGVTYTSIEKSDSITVSPTTVSFPLLLPLGSSICKFGVYCETDSTSFNIRFTVYKRDKQGVAAYVSLFSNDVSAVAQGYIEIPLEYRIIRCIPTGEDWYFTVKVTLTTPGTYFYLGNPCVSYV